MFLLLQAPDKTGAFFYVTVASTLKMVKEDRENHSQEPRAFKKGCPGFIPGERGGELHQKITKPGHKCGSGRMLPESPKTLMLAGH